MGDEMERNNPLKANLDECGSCKKDLKAVIGGKSLSQWYLMESTIHFLTRY